MIPAPDNCYVKVIDPDTDPYRYAAYLKVVGFPAAGGIAVIGPSGVVQVRVGDLLQEHPEFLNSLWVGDCTVGEVVLITRDTVLYSNDSLEPWFGVVGMPQYEADETISVQLVTE